MKVKVNEDACIGCGACCAIADSIFEIGDNGLSEVKKEEVQEDEKQAVRDAAEACPTGAIEVEE
ncbi:tRNA (guanine-N(7)-)-methyltransferase [Mycoplasma sp. CAG:877]|jgi:ferredoxin|nr:tRNA (guanine-N(7)-)-methyltransferase [Mycoplasma sp. CAG:877]